MKISTNRVLLFVFLIASAFFGHAALAQSQFPDLASLNASTPPGDWSVKMWKSLFGEFAVSPFMTLGAPTTLLGSLFVIFNGCIFVVGFTWAMYGILSGVVATAHEGEVLGKKMSSVWFPIRMITGISGMVPIFGGFTLMQAIMMTLTMLGIGIGNMMWAGAVNNSSQFQGLMQNDSFSPSGVTQVREATHSLFLSNVCIISELQNYAQVNAGSTTSNTPGVVFSLDSKSLTRTMNFGTPSRPQMCGYFAAKASMRSGNNPLAFRSGSVDYGAIENQANLASNAQMEILQAKIDLIATRWYVARDAAIRDATVVPPVPLDEIDGVANDFVKKVSSMVSTEVLSKTGAIKEAAKDNMLRIGWFGAGAWYSTFAEINAGIADAAKGPTMSAQNGGGAWVSSTTRETLAAALKSLQEAKAARSADSSTGDASKGVLDDVIKDSCAAMPSMSSIMGTATGNCSLGQAIVASAIRATAIGSGGGGNGSLSLAFDSEGLVNPIIMMKNMGDYVMTFSSSLLLAGATVDTLAWVAEKGGSFVKAIPGVSTMGAAAETVGKKFGTALAIAKVIAMFALVVGAAMAIYIPLIPFITWMGAILAYAASMIEGLAGATLHAMAHLEADGDGMGQRTSHGYMFYINAVARPGLMIIGFFVASALLVAIGTLQAHLFLPAMANVQGNSVTGLFSIVMFLVVFFVINLTLITACFNLIYVITDQVIGFVGGQVDSKLGRDTEDKVNNMFLMAARVGPTAIAAAGKASGETADSDKGSGGKPGGRGK